MSNNKIEESKKAAIAIKTGRTAVGLNQTDFAKLMSVSRVTLARIETFEIPIKLESYFNAVRALKNLGVIIDATSGENITIDIAPTGQQLVIDNWKKASGKKADKK